MEQYIEDAKSLSLDAFLSKYKHPFLIQISEPEGEEGKSISDESTTKIKDVREYVKKTAKNIEIKNVYPVVLCKRYHPHDQRIIVGRQSNQDIVVTGEKVSKFHAFFATKDKKEYIIRDMSSKNGTFINGERIDSSKPVSLKSGDIVSFADFSFRYLTSDASYYTLRLFEKSDKK